MLGFTDVTASTSAWSSSVTGDVDSVEGDTTSMVMIFDPAMTLEMTLE